MVFLVLSGIQIWIVQSFKTKPHDFSNGYVLCSTYQNEKEQRKENIVCHHKVKFVNWSTCE